MAEIRFSPAALSDLKQTKTYIAEELCSKQAAINTVSKILNRIRMLSDLPEAGSPLAAIVNFATDYRFLVCGNYISFYRYENDTVYVVRILYGRRDYIKTLFGDIEE